MKKTLIILLVIGLGLYGNQVAKNRRHQQSAPAEAATGENYVGSAAAESNGQFKCDGRTYCSEMTSCAEATFFLQNCPDVKMDGNNDGIPCEKQWCK